MIIVGIMKQPFLLAGAAALAFAGPAFAKPGHGKGNPHGYDYGVAGPVGYGVGGCPPGLAKKHNGCRPPGQVKQLYRLGQRFPLSYGHPWTYNQIPYDLRSRYGFDPGSNYYYGDGYLYRVDPRTMLIRQVVSALLYR
jgi:hypothetical protein